MAEKQQNLDEILRKVGHDSTSTFDDGPSNPTEYAGSESMSSATAPDDVEDEDLIDEDDEAAELENEDEESEGEDVEDEAYRS